MYLERLYRALNATGLRRRSSGARRLFRFAYFRYKRLIEDPFLELTRRHPEFFENGHVIDVGANLGYTTDVFSRATGVGWKVIAFEPNAINFASLSRARSNVIPIRAAVGRKSGSSRLWLNRSSPADHRIVTQRFSVAISHEDTAPVEMVSIDDFLSTGGAVDSGARISFCKIDVQGFEPEVLRGMRQTIQVNPDITLAMEYCPGMMRDLGFDESSFFEELDRHRFKYYRLRRSRPLTELTPARVNEIVGPEGYADIICTRRRVRTSVSGRHPVRSAGSSSSLSGASAC